MSQTELDNETKVLRKFESEYQAIRADYIDETHNGEPPHDTWCDPDNCVCIGHSSLTKVGPMSIQAVNTQPTGTIDTIESDKGTELYKLTSPEKGINGNYYTHVQVMYIEMLSDVFGVHVDEVLDNIYMKPEKYDWPVIYKPENVDLIAMISPYIHD